MNIATPGPNSVAEFLSSGLPWVKTLNLTTAPIMLEFPFLTRALVINSSVNQTLVAFTSSGLAGTNYITIPANEPVRLEIKTRRIWIQAVTTSTVSVLAEMTGIESRQFPIYDGSPFASISSI